MFRLEFLFILIHGLVRTLKYKLNGSIIGCMLRQANRYGVGIDHERDSDGYSLQRGYLQPNEEARQLTRSC